MSESPPTVTSGQSPAASLRVGIDKVFPDAARRADSDFISVEEPLEIRLSYTARGERVEQSISVTMRTPGNDEELAVGFLAGEAIIRRPGDVLRVEHAGAPSPDKGVRNVIRVELADDIGVDAGGLLRHFYTTSSCGVCGKASLDAVRVQLEPRPASTFSISAMALGSLPQALRAKQTEFARTGGLHATASFDAAGAILRVREDVGRHNAFDKLAGSYLAGGNPARIRHQLPAADADALDLPGRAPSGQFDVQSSTPALPCGPRGHAGPHLDALATNVGEESGLASHGILLSGRASFELLQKAAVAGSPLVAAIGPPSSLAVELAQDRDITLVGFLKSDRFNIYSGRERITA